MKNAIIVFVTLLSIFLIEACQKELAFDPATNPSGLATGTLKSNTTGNCLPSTVNGTYKKDTALTAGNYIEVTADITQTGTYTIQSDTVNGFSFKALGTVTATGLNIIRLQGSGTPIASGITTFTIKFGNSICKLDVSVTATTAPTNAVFTFGGAPGNCSGATLGIGAYIAGTALGPTNTVTLNVNVTTIGNYTINTGVAVNGIVFNASGTFANIGPNTVILIGSGTPTAAGSFNYTVSNTTSSCIFSIAVTAAPPAPNLDYVPQTTNSNWSSRFVGGTPSDTTYVQVSANSKTFGANSYKIFEIKNLGVPTDSIFNRKNGGLYYQYLDGDFGLLDNPINKEYLVLDSNLAVGATWTVSLGSNTVSGFPVAIKVNSLILAKGASATIASINYTNIIKVKFSYIANPGTGDITAAEEERWFAKGIGVVYTKIVNLINPATIEAETTRSQIF
ncbi:MAG: hypothetical protein IPP48_03945 [Chitinophagaceae bacterium]|nr:hypothetical protein [Chitinophagaceae bacterium]